MLKIGHRGAPRLVPENTIASFQKAIELGANGIELDVHVCKTGELVVFHDDGVDRLTDGKGLVSDLTLVQLQALTIYGGGHIPTLAQVLDALGKDIHYFIELKPAEAVIPTTKLLQDYVARGWDKLVLISFIHEALRQAPDFHIGATFDKMSIADIEKAKAMNACMVLPNHNSLTRAQVEHAHRLGLQVIPWTVNSISYILRMRELGVDGIMSDNPDIL